VKRFVGQNSYVIVSQRSAKERLFLSLKITAFHTIFLSKSGYFVVVVLLVTFLVPEITAAKRLQLKRTQKHIVSEVRFPHISILSICSVKMITSGRSHLPGHIKQQFTIKYNSKTYSIMRSVYRENDPFGITCN